MGSLLVAVIANSSAEAQPIVPLPIVTMTPSYHTQMAIFCAGGQLRMWQYEPGKGLIYCEEPTTTRTHANVTAVAPATYAAGTNGYSTAAMASAVHAAVIALRNDIINVKGVLNQLIDDLQAYNMV